jgi:hypothetical protein
MNKIHRIAVVVAAAILSIAQICPAQTSMPQHQQLGNYQQSGNAPYVPTRTAAYENWVGGNGASYPSVGYTLQEQASGAQAAQAGGAGGAAGAGAETPKDAASAAAAAVDPTAPLSQMQFQNVFIPETYGGSGYANIHVIQTIFAIQRKPDAYFPYHIIRPTLPILAPTADPDGPIPDIGGLGDTALVDLYVHPVKKGVNLGFGPTMVFPTSTDRRLGLGEWQIGPALAYIDAARFKDSIVGGLVQVPFSLESDAYSVTFSPIATRILKDGWFAGIGDLALKLNDQDGNYNIPLSMQVGKVIAAGKQPLKLSVQPEWTPSGLTSQPTAKYGVKFTVSILLPGAEFGYSKEKAAKRNCRHGRLGSCHLCK